MKKILLFAFLLALLFPFQVLSQDYSTKSKKAIQFFQTAMGYYDQRNDKMAMQYVEMAIAKDNKFIEAWLLKAELRNQAKDFTGEIDCYNKVFEINPSYNAKVYYLAAKAELKLGMYQEARSHIDEIARFSHVDDKTAYYTKIVDGRLDFALHAIDNPVPFHPELVKNVCTEFDDYWPSLTADEMKLVTTVQLPIDARFPVSGKNRQEDLFISLKREDGSWSEPMNMGPPVNTLDNEGAQSFRADGLQLFLTVCNRREDFGSCDIYVATKVNGRWTTPMNIGRPVNSSAWEAHPSATPDGRILYFSCGNCKETRGAADIYYTTLGDDGMWSVPVNLGDSINGPGNEMSPFIHPDGKTLYFSSESHVGMGGMDLYMAQKKDDGSWSRPVNLGYPINTFADEIGLVVNARGDYAYFSSNREGSQGLDIYGFEMPEKTRPGSVTYVKGIVYDAITQEKLSAGFELFDMETGNRVFKSCSASGTGEFLVTLPLGKEYALNVDKEGYLFFSENYTLTDATMAKPYQMDVPLQKISKGASIVLKNVFFKTDSYELDDRSVTELNKLVDLLNKQKGIKIEIGGHTDNQGSMEHNKALSMNRAKAVYSYLISNGIDAKRLTYNGYGYSKPIATNDTEEGRALNRRTEFRITEVAGK